MSFCDVLRNRNKMVREIFNKAVQGYVKDTKKNIPNLMEYAKVLHVQTILQAAIFETLQRRGTSYGRDSFKRVAALAENEDMQKRWKFFLKNIKENTLEFPFVIAEIRTFLIAMELLVNIQMLFSITGKFTTPPSPGSSAPGCLYSHNLFSPYRWHRTGSCRRRARIRWK